MGTRAAVAQLTKAKDEAGQRLILDEMLRAFEGRLDIAMPASWTPAYEHLIKSESAEVRDRADRVAVLLGDQRIFPRMRAELASAEADVEKRRQALEILVHGRDPQAAAALHAVLDEPRLRGAAIRALAAYDEPKTAKLLLARYTKLAADEQRDAIGTLIARPQSAMALLDAIQAGDLPRGDLHAYHIRQLMQFGHERLEAEIRESWGEVRESSSDKQEKIAQWKAQLTKAALARANLSNGRRLYEKNCAACPMRSRASR